LAVLTLLLLLLLLPPTKLPLKLGQLGHVRLQQQLLLMAALLGVGRNWAGLA
jgi:hypothetical protein